jgi:hypothetical protein
MWHLGFVSMLGILAASPAVAMPQLPVVGAPSAIEKIRADCRWVDNKWTYRKGDKVLECRPDSPGRGWIWHREGTRFGWYHPGRKEWHYKNW